ncbi:hypothetical protein ACTXT7_014469 [Hymenolepis weldensis]
MPVYFNQSWIHMANDITSMTIIMNYLIIHTTKSSIFRSFHIGYNEWPQQEEWYLSDCSRDHQPSDSLEQPPYGDTENASLDKHIIFHHSNFAQISINSYLCTLDYVFKIVTSINKTIAQLPVEELTQKNRSVFGFSLTKKNDGWDEEVNRRNDYVWAGYVWADPTEVPTVRHAHEVSITVNADADACAETLQTIVLKPPWIDSVVNGGGPYVFQQDSAPFRKALKTHD